MKSIWLLLCCCDLGTFFGLFFMLRSKWINSAAINKYIVKIYAYRVTRDIPNWNIYFLRHGMQSARDPCEIALPCSNMCVQMIINIPADVWSWEGGGTNCSQKFCLIWTFTSSQCSQRSDHLWAHLRYKVNGLQSCEILPACPPHQIITIWQAVWITNGPQFG